MGYFEVTMHVRIAFRVDSSSKLAIPHLYLSLLIGILGLRCNTSIHTYFYQLEFWGLIVILALVLTSTNWDFGA
jgi:hypothetical protein